MGDSSTETTTTIHCDALIVGAGFSGVAMLHRLRKLNLNAKIFEAGAEFGGTWSWNRYPGARVDSEFPFYQLNIPEVYSTWSFSERYPDHRELRRYFAHCDAVLNLRKDTYFGARVVSCQWSDDDDDGGGGSWTVRTQQGHVATARFLLCCTGLLHHRHIPDLPGLRDFAASGRPVHHSSEYPDASLDLHNKRVALVGSGATAVQITQEVAKTAAQLTIFMRRPSICLPAVQRPISNEENWAWQGWLDAVFKASRGSAGGFLPTPMPTQGVFDVDDDEREARLDSLLRVGGFRLWTGGFTDVVVDEAANRKIYEYWMQTVRRRMTDTRKMDIVAPLPDKQPYFAFTKRPPLEVDYYEMVDQRNVDVFNTNETPWKRFNATGVEMADGRQLDFDVVLLATGFDAFSGSVTHMGIKNRDGVDIADVWSSGLRSYTGMTVAGFPNLFMSYTAFAPTALSNGPTIIEVQCDFACEAIRKMLDEDIKYVEATRDAEDEWAAYIDAQNAPTLYPRTDSWWNGTNVPGKKAQMLTYLLGLGKYEQDVRERLATWKGFDVKYNNDKKHVEHVEHIEHANI